MEVLCIFVFTGKVNTHRHHSIGVARGPAGRVLAGPLFSADFFFLRGGGGGGGGGQLMIERTLAASTNHRDERRLHRPWII